MPKPIFFVLPEPEVLAHPEGWTQDRENKQRYYAIRRHFALVERQVDATVRHGAVLNALSSVQGVAQKHTFTVKYEKTSTDVLEYTREVLDERESTDELAASLAPTLGRSELLKISLSLGAKAQERLKSTVGSSARAQWTEAVTTGETVTREFTVDPSQFPPGTTVVVVPGYTRHAYDLYLHAIDYLIVDYWKKSGLFARNYNRVKTPPVQDPPSPQLNAVRVNLPMASLHFWYPLPDTFLPLSEARYDQEVPDPSEIEVHPLETPRNLFAAQLFRPTLYELSNRAFPLRAGT
jgi:hypothetical protein